MKGIHGLLSFLKMYGLTQQVSDMAADQFNESFEESIGRAGSDNFFNQFVTKNTKEGQEFWDNISFRWEKFRREIKFVYEE